MKLINLTKGKSVIVDDEDFIWLNNLKWHYRRCGNSGYAVRVPYKQPAVYMHRLIMLCPIDFEVDHINGNPLDNRKENLRFCSRSENCRNSKIKSNNKSGFKGVDCLRGKWRVTIQGQHIGYFVTKEEVAKEYNREAIKRYSEFGKLNII